MSWPCNHFIVLGLHYGMITALHLYLSDESHSFHFLHQINIEQIFLWVTYIFSSSFSFFYIISCHSFSLSFSSVLSFVSFSVSF